ncbi:MAG: DHH family phosphoesterase [Anaerotignaceae bacterium]
MDELRKLIELSNTIAISGHTSPDGDAVGACAGLAMSLRELGKDVVVILEDYPEVFNLIPTGGLFVNKKEPEYLPDLYIAVDCGDKERLGYNAELFDKTLYTICIDHHKSNTNFAKVNFVDEECSSTCELVFQLIYGFSPINEQIAAALYAGMVFDTGGFRHSSTSPVTMAIASNLMEYEFDFTKIYNSIFHRRTVLEAKMLGLAIGNLEHYLNSKVVCTYITLEEMKANNATKNDLSEVTNYIKGIKDCLVSVFIYEKENGAVKISMRSEDPVDVCEICQVFGGGGHIRAAGATVEGNIIEIKNSVIEEIKKQLSML